MTDRRWLILLTILIVITAARVATTYRVFSQTMDEPFHLAVGYDFLLTGRQISDPQHPPLARVFFALPFLRTPPPAWTDGLTRGNALSFVTIAIRRISAGRVPAISFFW